MNQNTKELCNRLRGIYNTPVSDGAGLLDGKDTVTRKFETPAISKEAADKIEELNQTLQECWDSMRYDEYGAPSVKACKRMGLHCV